MTELLTRIQPDLTEKLNKVDWDTTENLDKKYPGLEAINLPPEFLGKSLDAITAWHEQKERELIRTEVADARNAPEFAYEMFNGETVDKVRASYHLHIPDVMQAHFEAVNNAGVYNQAGYELHQPEAAEIDRLAREQLASGKYVVILPLIDKEKPTAPDVAAYAADLVGAPNVIAVHSGKDESLTADLRNNVNVVKQDQVLQYINWKMLKDQGFLPKYPISDSGEIEPGHKFNTKGLTMLAGAVTARALGMTEEQKRVCFVDTDIKDIGEKYKPLEYMALADALAPGEKPVSTQILRTGPGRNNEMWIAAANALGVEGVNAMHIAALLEHGQLDEETQSWVAEEYDRISRSPESATRKIELSRLLSRIGWPLTGERSIDGTFLTNMHFSTGMGIETAIDVAVAGYEVATRELQLTQVCDPNQKIENGESLTDREQNLINLCTRFQKALTSHIDRTGKLPHEWSLQDVKRFNLLHAKLTMAQTTASLQEHTAQTTSLVEQEFLLPTVEQLVEIGAVDLEAIKEYFYQNNRHFQN